MKPLPLIKTGLGNWAWIGIGTAAVAVFYLFNTWQTAGLGFPLDDAWIHQTYARNLALTGQWAFIPGQLSGGSTAPLWSLALSLGTLTGSGPYWETFLLGAACLWGVAVVGQAWWGRMAGGAAKFAWVGLFLVGEWHLDWSAFSGMETLAYALVILGLFLLLQKRSFGWLAGALVAIATWLRPDGITLLGPALFAALLTLDGWRARLKAAGKILLPALGGVLAYALFNLAVAGSILPNTFFAKQAEYAAVLELPLLQRFFSLLALPMIGPGIVLLPGVLAWAWRTWKRRDWISAAALLWWLGYTLIYALRLPVTYQYGRYLVPVMPVYFVLGLAGSGQILSWLGQKERAARPSGGLRWAWLARRSWLGLLAGLWLIFGLSGVGRYATDVGIINTEMVAVSGWINANTAPSDRIAIHDIGAVGYFCQRPLIDLAGLVSPEVIPFIRDEQKLASYLDASGVKYLVTFPGWYPDLIKGRRLVYQTNGGFAPQAGGENMAVYAWQ